MAEQRDVTALMFSFGQRVDARPTNDRITAATTSPPVGFDGRPA